MPIEKTGFLSKHKLQSKEDDEETSTPRFFILQGGMLRYFKNEADEFPKGQISLTPNAAAAREIEIDTSARPHFTVFSVEFPRGMLIKCSTNNEMDQWVTSITNIAQTSDMALFKRRELPTWGWW